VELVPGWLLGDGWGMGADLVQMVWAWYPSVLCGSCWTVSPFPLSEGLGVGAVWFVDFVRWGYVVKVIEKGVVHFSLDLGVTRLPFLFVDLIPSLATSLSLKCSIV
jgi:hypothetical protein